MIGNIEKSMSNPCKRKQKGGGEENGEKWDRGKGNSGEQFHFTLHIHQKQKCEGNNVIVGNMKGVNLVNKI